MSDDTHKRGIKEAAEWLRMADLSQRENQAVDTLLAEIERGWAEVERLSEEAKHANLRANAYRDNREMYRKELLKSLAERERLANELARWAAPVDVEATLFDLAADMKSHDTVADWLRPLVTEKAQLARDVERLREELSESRAMHAALAKVIEERAAETFSRPTRLKSAPGTEAKYPDKTIRAAIRLARESGEEFCEILADEVERLRALAAVESRPAPACDTCGEPATKTGTTGSFCDRDADACSCDITPPLTPERAREVRLILLRGLSATHRATQRPLSQRETGETLTTIVRAVEKAMDILRSAAAQPQPREPLTEAEARAWGADVRLAVLGEDNYDGGCEAVANALLAANRGDIPPEVRPGRRDIDGEIIQALLDLGAPDQTNNEGAERYRREQAQARYDALVAERAATCPEVKP